MVKRCKRLHELVTSEDNPLCISPFIVHYMINEGRVEYKYYCKVYTFIERKLCIEDGVAKHKGVVNPFLQDLLTSLQDPLMLRKICLRLQPLIWVSVKPYKIYNGS